MHTHHGGDRTSMQRRGTQSMVAPPAPTHLPLHWYPHPYSQQNITHPPSPIPQPTAHSLYNIANTHPQKTPTQTNNQLSPSRPTQAPTFRNNVTEILCNKFLKIDILSPQPRRSPINQSIHTLTNPNCQPYLKFEFDETAPAKNTPVPIKYTAISTDIPKTPKENTATYPNVPSTPTNT